MYYLKFALRFFSAGECYWGYLTARNSKKWSFGQMSKARNSKKWSFGQMLKARKVKSGALTK